MTDRHDHLDPKADAGPNTRGGVVDDAADEIRMLKRHLKEYE